MRWRLQDCKEKSSSDSCSTSASSKHSASCILHLWSKLLVARDPWDHLSVIPDAWLMEGLGSWCDFYFWLKSQWLLSNRSNVISNVISRFSHRPLVPRRLLWTIQPCSEVVCAACTTYVWSPRFVLIPDSTVKIKLIGFSHKRCNVSFLSFQCKFTGDITEGVRLIFTLARHDVRISTCTNSIQISYINQFSKLRQYLKI